MFTLIALGPKEAEVKIIGCDLHARQQTLAMLDTTTGEVVRTTLKHVDHVAGWYRVPRVLSSWTDAAESGDACAGMPERRYGAKVTG